MTKWLIIFSCFAVFAVACGSSSSSVDPSVDTGSDGDVDGDTDGDTDGDGDTDSGDDGWDPSTDGTIEVEDGGVVIVEDGGVVVVCYETICDGRLLECGDCVDNDGDGKIDWRDRECLGPCDNTEGPALISDVGGVTGSTCHVDCYFDYGNGMGTGSDDCWWDHQCDPLEPEKELCPYDEKVVNNEQFCPEEQSELCDQICVPFTPNGCDCFGCCTFPELDGLAPDGTDQYVWIGAKDADNNGICTFDDILDPTKCPPCTPIDNCLNECDHCEICIGKPTLPPDCYDEDGGPPAEQCPEGVTPCGLPEQEPCGPDYYCVSGCCRPTVIVI